MKKISILLLVIVVCAVSGCGSLNKKNVAQGSDKISSKEVNYLPDNYQELEDNTEIDIISEGEEKIEYDDCIIEINKYIYDLETKISYIELSIEQSGIEEEYKELIGKMNSGELINIGSKYNVGEHIFGVCSSDDETFGITPSGFDLNGNVLTLHFFIVDCDGKIFIKDFSKNENIGKFLLRDTIDDKKEIEKGIFISPIGIYFSDITLLQVENVNKFDFNVVYNDGSTCKIEEMYKYKIIGKEKNNSISYTFKKIQDVNAIADILVTNK